MRRPSWSGRRLLLSHSVPELSSSGPRYVSFSLPSVEYCRVLVTPTGLTGFPCSSSQPAMPSPHPGASAQMLSCETQRILKFSKNQRPRIGAAGEAHQEVFAIGAGVVAGPGGQELQVVLITSVWVDHGAGLQTHRHQ